MPVGQVWSLSANGGYFANAHLSRSLYKVSQPNTIFEQFCDEDEAFGKQRGDTLDFNKISNLNAAGAELTEGVRMPQANWSISRGQVVAKEYGLATNWTSKFAMLSEFDVEDPIQGALSDDRAKTHDRIIYRNFRGTMIKYIPTGLAGAPTVTWDTTPTVSADGVSYNSVTAATQTATRDIALYDFKNCIDALRKGVAGTSALGGGQPVKPYTGTDYMFIGGVDTCRQIFDDPDFEDYMRYGDPSRLWNGECGRVYSGRITMENYNIGFLGSTSFRGAGFMFGKQTVKRISVVTPEMRRGIPGDFGRDLAMCWYSSFGSSKVWSFNVSTEAMFSIIEIHSY